MSLDKLFFVELMTNGIPVKENIDLLAVLRSIEEHSEIGDYQVVIIDEEMGILDGEGNICTSLKLVENSKDDWRLVFFTPVDQDKLLDIARQIGSVLMVAFSACAEVGCLDLSKLPRPELIGAPTGEEETEEFESDFI